MNSREFCYWLQSAFEVMETEEFNEEQTQLIKSNLSLALKNNDMALKEYCTELKGYFDLVQPTSIDQKTTLILKEKLNNLFNHVVPEPYLRPNFPKRPNTNKKNPVLDKKMLC